MRRCIVLDYTSGVKGYQLWCVDPKSRKFIISKGVTFDEYAIFHKKKKID